MYELTEAHTAPHASHRVELPAQDPPGQDPNGQNPPAGRPPGGRPHRIVLVAVVALVVLAALVHSLLISLALTPVLELVDRVTDRAVQVTPTDRAIHPYRSTWSPQGAPTTTERGRT